MSKESPKKNNIKKNRTETSGSIRVANGDSQPDEVRPSYRVEKIGTVAIDTGHIVIVDPCRIGEVEERFDGPLELTGQLGQFVVGSETGLGDGRYPVFAEIINHEKFGERVTALHIHFDPVYCFADDPQNAERIKQDEAEYLAFMNWQ